MNREISPRETEILDLLCEGSSNPQIADSLGIGELTVKNHLNKIYFRYGIFGPCKRIRLVQQILRVAAPADITPPRFSAKELTILEMVSAAKCNREIARVIGTSEQTIKNNLRKIYDRTGCSSKLELAVWQSRLHAEPSCVSTTT